MAAWKVHKTVVDGKGNVVARRTKTFGKVDTRHVFAVRLAGSICRRCGREEGALLGGERVHLLR